MRKKPDKLKMMQGTMRADRAIEHPKPLGTPTCPDWLDTVGREAWGRVCDELNRLGLLTSVDGDTLGVYCKTFSRWFATIKFLDENGTTYTTDTGYIRERPEVAISLQLQKELREYAKELGLSPSARQKLEVEKPKQPDEFDLFLQGAKLRNQKQGGVK